MTKEQLEKLIEYIDTKIDQELDYHYDIEHQGYDSSGSRHKKEKLDELYQELTDLCDEDN